VLEQTGLVSRGRVAELRPVCLNVAPLAEVAHWLGTVVVTVTYEAAADGKTAPIINTCSPASKCGISMSASALWPGPIPGSTSWRIRSPT
jgi:hypothetical protein